ncbi:hypothetical protein [Duganella qianjiadongensis]|uniref:Lactate dehydrogenase n=1 Tax=Duganella qianjiadongensis TaxID=2692176 RepID=A0ABW9VQG8_9BURK|nr:hypothetical protein [Duganella qianjiadongensis]MYM40658.1 hypothetical protein [Duganella qianjiadongensis]
MSTVNALASLAATPTPATASTNRSAAASAALSTRTASSTVVNLGEQGETSTKALAWENRTHSTSATLMARNMNNDELSTRLSGLGSELLKQVAYDGADFSQSVQQLPASATSDTYALQVSPAKISQHGMGDNQISLNIMTASGIKVELKLDASDNGIAVEAHSSGKLNDAERKALGKLSEAFQKSIDGLSENPPRIDLAGLTQFDSHALAAVDLKGQIKIDAKDTQRLEFHADSMGRTLSFNGPAGTASIAVDLSKPASWGSKAQQAAALDHYLQQIDQAATRGLGRGAIIGMFKQGFSALNSDYGSGPVAPQGIALNQQDHALTTGLADFNASFAQTEEFPNPARSTEKDSFAYELAQKTSIGGGSQLDRSISQQQSSHLKARYHAPIRADAKLALDLSPNSQNYHYVTIDDAASSQTEIAYHKGVLAKATLDMQASQSTRTLRYSLGKLQDDHTTPAGKRSSRDLLTTLEPERTGHDPLSETEQAQMLAKLHPQILLQQNPDALSASPLP